MKNFEVFTPVQLRWEACFYCGGHLPALKKEHIFNSSWTGKHKTGALICDECNAAFSFSVDTAFKSYTKYHMNVWSLKGERQKSVPTIETEGEIIIKSGAQPEEKPSSFFSYEEGNLFYTAKAPNKPALRQYLNEQLSKDLGRDLKEDEIKDIKNMVRNASSEIKPLNSVQLYDSIDPFLEIRSTVHTILKCMALFDSDFTKHVSHKVLDFSRHGVGNWQEFAFLGNSSLDVASTYFKHHPDYNAVEVYYLPSTKQILAKHIILGRIIRWVVLSNIYEGPHKILFVGEPSLGGILKKFLLIFSETFPPSAQIERGMKEVDFIEDLMTLAQITLGPDAQLARLFRGMEGIFNDFDVLTQEHIDEYKDTLLLFLNNMFRITSLIIQCPIPYSEEDMLCGLMDNGLTELEAYVGQINIAEGIIDTMSRPIQYVFSQVVQLGEEAKLKEKNK
ncbi:HNH endonuclease [Paenibacillus sp. FSL H7-0714]|uniref:HNH endonuclease n=1 Tax=Paenibacillus sp. FSL H7-0714 TaxID=2954735 RepID=UPI0030FA5539